MGKRKRKDWTLGSLLNVGDASSYPIDHLLHMELLGRPLSF